LSPKEPWRSNDPLRDRSVHSRRSRFPEAGIVFKDITPLLADANGFRAAIDALADLVEPLAADGILAIESRGFIFGAALAQRAGLPLQLVRKRGKLPRKSVSMEYALEYGVDHLEMHTDAVRPAGAI
jgi:adenine phosphoribosyltransferase